MTRRPPLDTDPQVEGLQLDAWRTMDASHRLSLVRGWSSGIRQLAAAGVRQRHPDADPVEQLVELGRVLFGAETMTDDVATAIRRHHRRS